MRVGLRYVRGLGSRARGALRAVLDEGPFRSVADVVARSGLGDAELRKLAAASAFRSWVPGGPRQALWAVLGEWRARRTGGPLAPAASTPVELPELDGAARTLLDHHTTGFDAEGHPMRHLRAYLRELEVEAIGDLREGTHHNGEWVKTAGLVIVRQRPGTAKGFVFVGLEDETGRLDVIVSPTVYERERETIRSHGILAVKGRLGVDDGVVNLKAERFFPLRLENAQIVVRSHDYR